MQAPSSASPMAGAPGCAVTTANHLARRARKARRSRDLPALTPRPCGSLQPTCSAHGTTRLITARHTCWRAHLVLNFVRGICATGSRPVPNA